MKRGQIHCSVMLAVLIGLVAVMPAFGDWETRAGAGPAIGLWDVADGEHVVGLHAIIMAHHNPAKENVTTRLDASYTQFWGEGSNPDYDVVSFSVNMIVAPRPQRSESPYWALAIGFGTGSGPGSIILGTGFGERFGWGIVEARFNLADTDAGMAAYVPVFVAFTF